MSLKFEDLALLDGGVNLIRVFVPNGTKVIFSTEIDPWDDEGLPTEATVLCCLKQLKDEIQQLEVCPGVLRVDPHDSSFKRVPDTKYSNIYKAKQALAKEQLREVEAYYQRRFTTAGRVD